MFLEYFFNRLVLLYKGLKDESALANVKATLLNTCLIHYRNGIRSVPLMGFITELVADALDSKSCSGEIYQQALQVYIFINNGSSSQYS